MHQEVDNLLSGVEDLLLDLILGQIRLQVRDIVEVVGHELLKKFWVLLGVQIVRILFVLADLLLLQH